MAILNTGYDAALHDTYGNTYSQWTVGFILYCHFILLYNFNSLIWLTGIVQVVSTCSRQPELITFSKKYPINNNANVPFLRVFNWKSNKQNSDYVRWKQNNK